MTIEPAITSRESEDLVRSESFSLPGMVKPVLSQVSDINLPPVEISYSPWYEEEVETTERRDRARSISQSSESTTTVGPASLRKEFTGVALSATQFEPDMPTLTPEISLSTVPASLASLTGTATGEWPSYCGTAAREGEPGISTPTNV